MGIDIKHFVKEHARQNIPLNYEESYALGVYALEGCFGNHLAQVQSIALLSSLHTKATYAWCNNGELHDHYLPMNAAEQIAGICAAVFENDIAKSEFGYLSPSVSLAMDNCGMGGDLIVTANVSTLAALIASAAGIVMCKHGSPANADQGRHGSSDFISQTLGLDTYCSDVCCKKNIELEQFGYTEALDVRYKHIHMQTHKVAFMPHMNDIIGPITNPLNPRILRRRVLGMNDLISPRLAAEAYMIMNKVNVTHLEHGLFIRGLVNSTSPRGMDEASICEGGTQVAELFEDRINEYCLFAQDFGLETAPIAAISPNNGMSKGDFSFGILTNEIGGASLDMVLANAALLFYLSGTSKDLKKCVNLAKEVHLSGGDYQKVLSLKKLAS